MKFGKNIRREMHNHSGMHYINYKVLKKLIKYINNSITEKELENGIELNKRFEEVLLHDLNIIEETFVKLFKEIMNIKKEIEKNYSTVEIVDNNDSMKISKECISFDTLLNILKEENVSKEFFNFCVQLSILSNKCKIIRTYVIYNYIGLIKILKKKNKHCGNIFRNIQITDILSRYTWCLSDELPKLISSVNIISDEFMQKYTNTNVTIEKYICPICLSLIHEPVTLNSCFHSFCWKCLATAIQKYSIDNCPSCRTKIVYDKNSFKIDGILNQFLEKHFLSSHDKEKNRPFKGELQRIISGNVFIGNISIVWSICIKYIGTSILLSAFIEFADGIFYSNEIKEKVKIIPKGWTFEKYCAYDDHFVDFSILPSKPLKEVQNFNILSYFYEFKNIRKRRKKKTKKIRVD
ncbi:hypothetical protein PFFCH_04534 [Plasmodium falciparum FCH/4]|uniref:RING-type domain-containing protein n=1 Tax=Plasmodium falciparum FCH/4 TaxID=1036724 RepID=A0A024VJB6_PLAFA|nr:hypothetical protein PFFCH_04534 [Plasmodium falciparum FCH/4]